MVEGGHKKKSGGNMEFEKKDMSGLWCMGVVSVFRGVSITEVRMMMSRMKTPSGRKKRGRGKGKGDGWVGVSDGRARRGGGVYL